MNPIASRCEVESSVSTNVVAEYDVWQTTGVIHLPTLSSEENITQLLKSFTQLHPPRMKLSLMLKYNYIEFKFLVVQRETHSY